MRNITLRYVKMHGRVEDSKNSNKILSKKCAAVCCFCRIRLKSLGILRNPFVIPSYHIGILKHPGWQCCYPGCCCIVVYA